MNRCKINTASRYLNYLCQTTVYINLKIRVKLDGNTFRIIRVIYTCAAKTNIYKQSLARNHVRFERVVAIEVL